MPKLLMKCDGVLADQWCPLDPPPALRPSRSMEWSSRRQPLAEAIGTVSQMPGRVGRAAVTMRSLQKASFLS